MLNTNSAILYEGPSAIDGKPIVAIATYSGRNRKTGAMVQTYILRADINPLDASKTGEDFSICGDCPLRGEPTNDPARKIAKGRRCYVNLAQGVLIVWRAYKRGVYAPTDDIAALGADRMVRLGTYGDPAAVPVEVWHALTGRAKGWTGYTHQWRTTPALRGLCMASVDNEAQGVIARAMGWRTFRVAARGETAPPVRLVEINCPASKESGARVQCESCGLCKGAASAGKSIMIMEH